MESQVGGIKTEVNVINVAEHVIVKNFDPDNEDYHFKLVSTSTDLEEYSKYQDPDNREFDDYLVFENFFLLGKDRHGLYVETKPIVPPPGYKFIDDFIEIDEALYIKYLVPDNKVTVDPNNCSTTSSDCSTEKDDKVI